jgi:hypothetical protein
VKKPSTLQGFGYETLKVNHLVLQMEMLDNAAFDASGPDCVDMPDRLIVCHHGIFPSRPICVHAIMDLTDSETAREIIYELKCRDGAETLRNGRLEGISAEEEAFEAWLDSMGETDYWIA